MPLNLEIFIYFLRLGSTGFGGPLALIAQMQKDLVEQKEWISRSEFPQIFGLVKAMPGPVAFQMAVFFGYRKTGFVGGLLAGFALIFPAFVALILISRFYQSFSDIFWVQNLLKGMGLGAFALIVWALRSLVIGYSKQSLFWILFVFGLALSYSLDIPEPILILIFGAVGVLAVRKKTQKLLVLDPQILTITAICLKAGAFVFGTGLAIIPVLEDDFVTKLHWLTHQQFMDAVAFGQLTPGPISLSVAFIGYKVSGLLGATCATVAIFLPAFVHQVTWFPRMQGWLSRQTWIGPFTLGVTAAVCSSIVMSLIHLGQGWGIIELAVVGLFLVVMIWKPIPSWLLVMAGGVLGWGLGAVGLF